VVKDLDWWDFERVAPSLLCLPPDDGSLIWEQGSITPSPCRSTNANGRDWLALRRQYHRGWEICTVVAEEFGPGKAALEAARESLEPQGMTIGNPQTVFNFQIIGRGRRDLERGITDAHSWTCQ